MLILLSGCANEDYNLGRAAASCMALLSTSLEVCQKIVEEKQGLLILKENAASGDLDLQIRALHVMQNMVEHSKTLAENLCADQGLELLSALELTTEQSAVKKYCQAVSSLRCYGAVT